eukprot:Nitzschia sp. Nitz4//scaffold12_size214221//12562//16305//NITZ4_001476-RA/size214221-augustus-gene-0.19-mRNA-1//-1//CDS//3329534948//5260//frame0
MDDFDDLLEDIASRSNSRDPHDLRLRTLVSSLTSVIQAEEQAVTAAQLYAKAVETLDGTLHQNHDDVHRLNDSMLTQSCLLDLFTMVIPHVDTAAVVSTFASVGRVLRGMMNATLGSETLDDLGPATSILCRTSKASAALILAVSSSENVGDAYLKTFLTATLLRLFHDRRARVKKTTRDELLGLLTAQCHKVVRKTLNEFITAPLNAVTTDRPTEAKCKELMDMLPFLQVAAIRLDYSKMGEKITGVFIAFLQQSGQTSRSLLLNGLLACLLAMLQEESTSTEIELFAARVLATFLQANTSLLVDNRDMDSTHDRLMAFGLVELSAIQRLLRSDPEKGCKLLPLLTIQLFKLSTFLVDPERRSAISEGLFSELSQLFRVELPDIRSQNEALYNKCCQACLPPFKAALELSAEAIWKGPLQSLSLLIVQSSFENRVAKEYTNAMVQLRSKIDPESPSTQILEEAVSTIVQGVGIEAFWKWINFSVDSVYPKRHAHGAWVLKLMRQAGSSCPSARLSFFIDDVLQMARQLDTLAVEKFADSVILRSLVSDLWSLLPAIASDPTDLAEALPKFAPIAVRALKDKRYPLIVISISRGIEAICKRLKERQENDVEMESDGFVGQEGDVESVVRLAEAMLPSLFKIVNDLYDSEQPSEDRDTATAQASSQVESITTAISSLAQFAPAALLERLFTKLIQRLLEASQSQSDSSDKMCALLSLSHALVVSGGLDEKSVVLLYRSLKPLVRTDETPPQVQKRAYKVLSELCNLREFVTSAGRLQELTELLTSASTTSQISARTMRIRCLQSMVNVLGDSGKIDQTIFVAFLGETLLCLKDSNKRTREGAYKLLLSLANVHDDNVFLIKSVTAAVASETSHMRSAAVLALSKLLHHDKGSDPRVLELFPSLLRTVLLLSDDPSREVCKSVVGFVRVAVSVCPLDSLRELTPDILNSLLKYHRGKDRFRAKIKIILKKLVRLFGYDFLFPLVPSSESRLLKHMKRLSDRTARQKEKGTHKLQENDDFEDMLASDEEDSDDGRTLVSAFTRKTMQQSVMSKRKRTADSSYQLRIKNDTTGAEFDVDNLTKRVVDHNDDGDSESEDEFMFNEAGQLVFKEQQPTPISEDMIPAAESAPSKGQAPKNNKSKKVRLGANYRSKKAGGDVKRKGQKLDPYAFVPLDGKNFTKKNRKAALEQMESVVRRNKRQRR